MRAVRVHISNGWSFDAKQEEFTFAGRLAAFDYDSITFRTNGSKNTYLRFHPSELEYLACK